MSKRKTLEILITIIALNWLMWDFIITQVLLLFSFYYDNYFILFGQVFTIVASIIAWLWVHYSSKTTVRRAERYEI